jgi:hypothetical protein
MDHLVDHLMTHEQLVEITRREVEKYDADSFTSASYTLMDDGQKRYAVVDVPNFPRSYSSQIVVMAQVVGEQVIIIEDITDKPLVDALMVNGNVRREQIVLVYAGETIEDTSAAGR